MKVTQTVKCNNCGGSRFIVVWARGIAGLPACTYLTCYDCATTAQMRAGKLRTVTPPTYMVKDRVG